MAFHAVNPKSRHANDPSQTGSERSIWLWILIWLWT